MKPQTKHAISAACITIILLALLIYMERNLDGVTLSMKVVMALMAVSTFYAFVMGINSAPAMPKKKNTNGPFIYRNIDEEPMSKEMKEAIIKSKKEFVEMEDGTWRVKE